MDDFKSKGGKLTGTEEVHQKEADHQEASTSPEVAMDGFESKSGKLEESERV